MSWQEVVIRVLPYVLRAILVGLGVHQTEQSTGTQLPGLDVALPLAMLIPSVKRKR